MRVLRLFYRVFGIIWENGILCETGWYPLLSDKTFEKAGKNLGESGAKWRKRVKLEPSRKRCIQNVNHLENHKIEKCYKCNRCVFGGRMGVKDIVTVYMSLLREKIKRKERGARDESKKRKLEKNSRVHSSTILLHFPPPTISSFVRRRK